MLASQIRQVRKEKLQNESAPNFLNLRPEFRSDFSRTSRALFPGTGRH